MRIEITHRPELGAVVMRCAENCDTDSRPLVSEVQFRHCPASFDALTACVAAALVFSEYCGELVEFPGVSIGLDHRNAVRTIVPQASGIYPIDASKKDIRQGRDILVVAEAASLARGRQRLSKPAHATRLITWSGDFVSATAPDKVNNISGQVFTNARLIAGDTAVSLAVGLLVGGRNASEIRVGGQGSSERPNETRLIDALSKIGISAEIH